MHHFFEAPIDWVGTKKPELTQSPHSIEAEPSSCALSNPPLLQTQW